MEQTVTANSPEIATIEQTLPPDNSGACVKEKALTEEITEAHMSERTLTPGRH